MRPLSAGSVKGHDPAAGVVIAEGATTAREDNHRAPELFSPQNWQGSGLSGSPFVFFFFRSRSGSLAKSIRGESFREGVAVTWLPATLSETRPGRPDARLRCLSNDEDRRTAFFPRTGTG